MSSEIEKSSFWKKTWEEAKREQQYARGNLERWKGDLVAQSGCDFRTKLIVALYASPCYPYCRVVLESVKRIAKF